MRMLIAIATALVTAGCVASGGGRLSDSQRLSAYRASTGEPVRSFRILGTINGWTQLGDRHLAVWARANEAYLLELATACPDLRTAFAIGIEHTGQRVEAGFDRVLVESPFAGAGRGRCIISTIWPVDTEVLEQAEDELKQMNVVQRGSVG